MDKPNWCNFDRKCSWWQVAGGRYCQACPDYKPKERKLDDWIKPYIDSINERFKQ